jgi:hypothetical protein
VPAQWNTHTYGRSALRAKALDRRRHVKSLVGVPSPVLGRTHRGPADDLHCRGPRFTGGPPTDLDAHRLNAESVHHLEQDEAALGLGGLPYIASRAEDTARHGDLVSLAGRRRVEGSDQAVGMGKPDTAKHRVRYRLQCPALLFFGGFV